jgi:hypothetical protein
VSLWQDLKINMLRRIKLKVPLLDLKAQLETLRPEMIKAVTEVLDSTHYIMWQPGN